MLTHLLERTFPLPLSSPSVWGKLPSHGDFVHQHATPADMQLWSRWLDTTPILSLLEEKAPVSETPSSSGKRKPSGWIILDDPSGTEQISHTHPWCFVLPPQALGISPHLPANRIITGVLAASCDKIGRIHPVIIWQTVEKSWLKQLAFSRHWLYWLARLLESHIPPASTPNTPNKEGLFIEQLNKLWHLITPGLGTRFGLRPEPLPENDLNQIIETTQSASQRRVERDTDLTLTGVRQLPWLHWPYSVTHQDDPHHFKGFFWQQTKGGSYIGLTTILISKEPYV